MYAILRTGGKQYKVSEGDFVKVESLVGEKGTEITLGDVLMINKDGKSEIGKPVIENAKIVARIVDHDKDRKIIVYKYKKRKGFERRQGHRQHYTRIMIKQIVG